MLILGASDRHLKIDTGLETVSRAWCKEVEQSTSKVFNKVFQLHLPLRLDIGAVHVCVQQDDCKGQDEDCVRVPELSHHTRVADAVALTVDIKQGKNILNTDLSNQTALKSLLLTNIPLVFFFYD